MPGPIVGVADKDLHVAGEGGRLFRAEGVAGNDRAEGGAPLRKDDRAPCAGAVEDRAEAPIVHAKEIDNHCCRRGDDGRYGVLYLTSTQSGGFAARAEARTKGRSRWVLSQAIPPN